MAELTPEQIAENEAKVIAETQAADLKKQSKVEALRELSEEYGLNAFEPAELKAKLSEFTKWQTDHKSEQELLQEKYNLLKGKETTWEKERLDFNSKLKASELGISQENLEDALKLAGGNPENLAEVVKKYPTFVTKSVIKFGITQANGDRNPNGKTEAEQYAVKWKDNPYYNPQIK